MDLSQRVDEAPHGTPAGGRAGAVILPTKHKLPPERLKEILDPEKRISWRKQIKARRNLVS